MEHVIVGGDFEGAATLKNLVEHPAGLNHCCVSCPHEAIAVRNAPSAAAGLSMGIARSTNELIVCVQKDVWLPADWDRLILNQYRMGERQFGPIGVAGVDGVGPVADGSSNSSGDWPHGLTAERIGWVEDRGRVLSDGPGLPAPVATLDELLLIVRQDSPLRFRCSSLFVYLWLKFACFCLFSQSALRCGTITP